MDMAMGDHDGTYDPSPIISEAESKWEKDKDIEGAVLVYQTALLEWGDDAMTGTDDESLRDGMASLYVAYANLYRKAKQYKSCEEAYEQAVEDPVVGGLGRLWLDYARFCEERNRIKSAQSLYIRALSINGDEVGGAVKDPDEREELWEEFHIMMVNHGGKKDLTLEELKIAVGKQKADVLVNVKDGEDSSDDKSDDNVGPSKKRKVEIKNNDTEETFTKRPALSTIQKEDSLIKSDETTSVYKQKLTGAQLELATASLKKKIEAGSQEMLSNNFPPALSAAWVARDGMNQPTIVTQLFDEKPSSSVESASGKEVLGAHLAFQVVQLLLGKKHETTNSSIEDIDIDAGSSLLNLVQGCWSMVAMFTVKAKNMIDSTEKKMREEYARVEEAGGDNESFLAAKRKEYQEIVEFLSWESRKLLSLQQNLLKKARVPVIDITIDENELRTQRNICSVLHSAFILRGKVGVKAHIALLQNNESKLSSELSSSTEPVMQQPMMMQGQQFFHAPQQVPFYPPAQGFPPMGIPPQQPFVAPLQNFYPRMG